MIKQKLYIVLFILSINAMAQVPETDIWLFKVEKKEQQYIYKEGLNITNRTGYDNQPCFTPDGKKIMFTSIRDDQQADIYQYEISTKKTSQFIKTPESEYSPTITPDQKHLSCVVVLKDSSQVIQQFDLLSPSQASLVSSTDSVGYHTWLNQDSLLYYKLTEPHSLRVLNLKTGKDVWLCDNPSRAFKIISGKQQFIYAVKDTVGMTFRKYDIALKESRVLAYYLSLNEDFIWHPELGLIKSEGSSLLKYNTNTHQWENLFNFESVGIKKISRFVFDPKTKYLAVVSHL